MASYAELYDLFTTESEVRNKVSIAVAVAADTIFNENPATTNHTNRLIWAKQALQNPLGKAAEMFPSLLAQNKDAAVSAIMGASDATIQSNVDGSIDLFADGSS